MTSTSAGSPFSRTPPRRTATVQLTVRNVQALTVERALGAVMMVSHALEIAPDDIVLTDQTGKLWNGAPKRDKSEETVESWLEHKQGYDERLSAKANAALADILGTNRARVEIDSLWNFDKSTTSEQLSVDGALRSKTTNLSETPINSGSQSATGAGVLDVGASSPDPSGAPVAAAAPPARATTSEEKFEYDPSVTRKETVRTSPTLERLSVALFLDSSIAPADRTAIESAVKAAVGYDVARNDTFSTVSLGFAVDEPVASEENGETGETPAADGASGEAEPSAMTRMIIRRGVEIVVAVVFIGLLLSSLRSSKKTELARGAGGAAGDDDGDVDPELLAQAQVQDLLTSDPKRVGEILSEWARDAKAGAAR
jgi:flagellar biosynthesis/type III secretory pathway M-ring protein FliF/YscJ